MNKQKIENLLNGMVGITNIRISLGHTDDNEPFGSLELFTCGRQIELEIETVADCNDIINALLIISKELKEAGMFFDED